MRNNRYITDLKYETKRTLDSMQRKLDKLSYKWGEVDFFIISEFDEIKEKLSEIVKEIDGIDAKTH
tara:strand:+ start:7471 stop:7668 length:198 start_codon:yes stop_codon:yes gene_type:complete